MARRRRKTRDALTPLTDAELQRSLRPRLAVSGATEQSINFSFMVPASQPPEVRVTQPVLSAAQIIRYKGQAGTRRRTRAFGVEVAVRAADLGTRVFRPTVRGTRLQVPAVTKESLEAARAGIPSLDGFRPQYVALQPTPPPIERELRVRKFYEALPGKAAKRLSQATTIFAPDNRYTFSDTSFPWCTLGRVTTAGGQGSGVLIGPRHLLTVSHIMVWNSDNSSGWIRFAPSYFDGDEPFGAAWGVHWYAYKKVVGPSLDLDEQRQDYVVVVLDTRLGDVCGWMGSRTYSEDWDGGAYWRHVGYPGDLAAGQRPSYERDISLDGVDSNSHRRALHKGDVWLGQSGGPFFAWWTGEGWPRVIAVQSGQSSNTNLAAAGSWLVNCIISARNDFP